MGPTRNAANQKPLRCSSSLTTFEHYSRPLGFWFPAFPADPMPNCYVCTCTSPVISILHYTNEMAGHPTSAMLENSRDWWMHLHPVSAKPVQNRMKTTLSECVFLVVLVCFINPRCTCAARVTVLGLCVRPSVCLLSHFLPLRATRLIKSNTNRFSTSLAWF